MREGSHLSISTLGPLLLPKFDRSLNHGLFISDVSY